MRWMVAGRMAGRLSWLVPVVALALQAGPSGVRSADACSGGFPGVGWSELRVPIMGGEKRLPIASDGFVLLHGVLVAEDAEDDVPLPWVRATNEAGDELPGTLRVLRTEGESATRLVYLGWQPNDPLTDGSVVTLRFSEAPDEAGAGGAGNAPSAVETIELEVVGEPTPLPLPVAELDEWVEVRHGVGKLVQCEANASSCGVDLLQVPTEEERVAGVGVSWMLPGISGLVAWEVWAETSDPSDAAARPTPSRRQLVDRERDVIPSVHDVVAFAHHANEHCAVVVVKDLRTGEESRSQPRCEEPGTPTATLVDHDLSQCDDPPTPESIALWCADRAEDERCAGVDPDAAGGHGGSGPDGEKSGGAGRASDSDPMEGEAAAARHATSSGCRYAPATGGLGLWMTAVGLVLLTACRRTRRSCSRT